MGFIGPTQRIFKSSHQSYCRHGNRPPPQPCSCSVSNDVLPHPTRAVLLSHLTGVQGRSHIFFFGPTSKGQERVPGSKAGLTGIVWNSLSAPMWNLSLYKRSIHPQHWLDNYFDSHLCLPRPTLRHINFDYTHYHSHHYSHYYYHKYYHKSTIPLSLEAPRDDAANSIRPRRSWTEGGFGNQARDARPSHPTAVQVGKDPKFSSTQESPL